MLQKQLNQTTILVRLINTNQHKIQVETTAKFYNDVYMLNHNLVNFMIYNVITVWEKGGIQEAG